MIKTVTLLFTLTGYQLCIRQKTKTLVALVLLSWSSRGWQKNLHSFWHIDDFTACNPRRYQFL